MSVSALFILHDVAAHPLHVDRTWRGSSTEPHGFIHKGDSPSYFEPFALQLRLHPSLEACQKIQAATATCVF